jgi:radical SAM protein with 4Fe4S-binding SPASM domain
VVVVVALDCTAAAPTPSHLRVYRRGARFLVFNPTAPAWVHTNAVGAIALKLMDGSRTFEDIAAECGENGVSPESVLHFFEKASEANMFEVFPPSLRWEKMQWRSRKITAIYLHMTNKCNLSCSYCYRNSSPRITIKHFGDEFIGFLKDASPLLHKNAKVTFSGGEPMIHPDFFQVAEYCHESGLKCDLLTNGMFIDEDNVARVAANFQYVKISLDGATEETHALTRGEGFDKVIRAIKLLANFPSVLVEAQMTLNQENKDDCHKLRALLPSSVRVKFTPAMPMGRGKMETDIAISNAEFINVDDATEPEAYGIKKLDQNRRSFGCHAGYSNLSISDRGDVYPCHLFHSNEFKLGNIFVDSIEDIFFSINNYEYSRKMDVEYNNPRCGSCDFRYLCGGGCKANPLHAHGDFQLSDTYCSFIRNNLVNGMFGETAAAAAHQVS